MFEDGLIFFFLLLFLFFWKQKKRWGGSDRQRQLKDRKDCLIFARLLKIYLHSGEPIALSFERSIPILPFDSPIYQLSQQILQMKTMGFTFLDSLRFFSQKNPLFDELLQLLVSSTQTGAQLTDLLDLYYQENQKIFLGQLEEKSIETGQKMIFPLIFFIIPGLFVILMKLLWHHFAFFQ